MIKHKTVKNSTEALHFFCKEVECGEFSFSRNEITKEATNIAVTITNPRERFVNSNVFNKKFIMTETFDILNENPPMEIYSKDMLEKTMGNKDNKFFFGNEMRIACSNWSLFRIYSLFLDDKNTRKAILDLSTIKPEKHVPCLIFAHFFIRNDRFNATVETRSTSVEYGLINDIFVFTTVQEIIYGWLKKHYADLKLGSFFYKTINAHRYVDSNKKYHIDIDVINDSNKNTFNESIALSYNDYIVEMGKLQRICEIVRNAKREHNLSTLDDVQPIIQAHLNAFNNKYYKAWAGVLTL